MKKIKVLFILLLTLLVLGISSCSGESKTWDQIKEDVNLLVENGFVILEDDTPETVESCNKSFSIEFEFYNYDVDFLIINAYLLQSQEDLNQTIGFYRFDDKSDAKKIYKLYVKDLTESSQARYYLFGDILCVTNSSIAIEVLDY